MTLGGCVLLLLGGLNGLGVAETDYQPYGWSEFFTQMRFELVCWLFNFI